MQNTKKAKKTFRDIHSFLKHVREQVGKEKAKKVLTTSGSRTLDDGIEFDGEQLSEALEATQRQWSRTPDGTLFWATTEVAPTLDSGLYKCIFNDSIGHAFQRLLVSTDDLIPLPDTATEEVVAEIQEFWEMEDQFEKRGFLHKRGILMFGEPGSGKTATIQQLIALIIEREGIAVYADDPHVLTACLQMLRRVEPTRPIIVILEDFETLTDRQNRENEWLSVLDGEAQINNVVFLATTNYIETLDKRFTDRPSRFDVVKPVPMPSAKARAMFLAVKEPSLTREELMEWVNETNGFSIAHMKELIISVRCFRAPLEEAVARLRQMQKREFSNEELEYDPQDRGHPGFHTEPKRKSDDDIDWGEWYPEENEDD